jgi:hypothetical protein
MTPGQHPSAQAFSPPFPLPLPQVIATNRSPCFEAAEAMGVRFYTDANDFCEEHPEVVLLSTSILSLEKVRQAGRQAGGCAPGHPPLQVALLTAALPVLGPGQARGLADCCGCQK